MNRLKKNQENTTMTNSLKNIKYLEINVIKEVKDLYNENYKTVKKETDKGMLS
jgi:hypothetical protein